jgi:hypothetical protein
MILIVTSVLTTASMVLFLYTDFRDSAIRQRTNVSLQPILTQSATRITPISLGHKQSPLFAMLCIE